MAQRNPGQRISPGEHGLHRPLSGSARPRARAGVVRVVGSAWVGVAAGIGRAQVLLWGRRHAAWSPKVPMAASVHLPQSLRCRLRAASTSGRASGFGDLAGFLTAWNLWVYGYFLVTGDHPLRHPHRTPTSSAPRPHGCRRIISPRRSSSWPSSPPSPWPRSTASNWARGSSTPREFLAQIVPLWGRASPRDPHVLARPLRVADLLRLFGDAIDGQYIVLAGSGPPSIPSYESRPWLPASL